MTRARGIVAGAAALALAVALAFAARPGGESPPGDGARTAARPPPAPAPQVTDDADAADAVWQRLPDAPDEVAPGVLARVASRRAERRPPPQPAGDGAADACTVPAAGAPAERAACDDRAEVLEVIELDWDAPDAR